MSSYTSELYLLNTLSINTRTKYYIDNVIKFFGLSLVFKMQPEFSNEA